MVVTPADINSRTKVVRKREITADVCPRHKQMVDREVLRTDLEADLRKLRSRVNRCESHTPNGKRARAELKRCEEQLQTLLASAA